jgi:hypothetical protein
MKAKVKKVVDQIVEILKEWNGVEAVVLQHFAEKDIYDPNFSVTLDVFRKGEIPDKDKRQVHFKDADFFESSSTSVKDRFMLGDLPVRISYKDTVRVDAVLNAIEGNSWMSMERGTYLFHRIATGTVVWTRGDWIKAVLSKLDSLPEDFWSTWIDSCNHRIDHFLGDIGASSIKEDELYFRLSLSGFLKAVAECLFAVNQVFEPGPRDYSAAIGLLENLPDGFKANWGSLLREDGELPMDRKREIASLLARSVFALQP